MRTYAHIGRGLISGNDPCKLFWSHIERVLVTQRNVWALCNLHCMLQLFHGSSVRMPMMCLIMGCLDDRL